MATETLKIELTGENKSALAAIKQTQKSAFQLKEELMSLQSAVFTERDTAKIKAYNKQIQDVEKQLKQTQNAGKAGFDEMGNAIEKTKSGAGGLYTSLARVAQILPGIGIAGIFSLALSPLFNLVKGLFELTEAEEAAADAAGAFETGMAKARESIIKVTNTFELAKEGTVSQKDALKTYNETLGDSFGKATSFADAQQKLTEKGSVYIQVMGLMAQSNALYASSAKVAAEGTEEFYKKTQTTSGNISRMFSSLMSGANPLAGQQVFDVSGSVKDLKESEKVSEQLANRAGEINKQAQALAASNGINLTHTQAQKQAVDKIAEVYKKLKIEIKAANDEFIAGDTTEGDKLAKSTDAYTKAMESLKTNGVSPLSDAYRKLNDERARFGAQNDVKPLETATGVMKEAKNTLGYGTPPSSVAESTGIKEALDKQETIDNNAKALREYNEQVRKAGIYAQFAGNALDGLFSNLEQGQNFGEAIGNVFKDIAKQIAIAAAKALIFQAILSAVSGGTSAAVGTTQKSGGGFFSLFKGLLGGGFADGGTASGPKSGYATLLHGTEHIIPDSKIDSVIGRIAGAGMTAGMMGGNSGGGDMNLQTRVVGNDLLIWLQRAGFSMDLRR